MHRCTHLPTIDRSEIDVNSTFETQENKRNTFLFIDILFEFCEHENVDHINDQIIINIENGMRRGPKDQKYSTD